MKAWRKNAAADKQEAIAAGTHERNHRYGRGLRDSYTRILPAPSFLVLALLLRGGCFPQP